MRNFNREIKNLKSIPGKNKVLNSFIQQAEQALLNSKNKTKNEATIKRLLQKVKRMLNQAHVHMGGPNAARNFKFPNALKGTTVVVRHPNGSLSVARRN
jgi:hypothetical protein